MKIHKVICDRCGETDSLIEIPITNHPPRYDNPRGWSQRHGIERDVTGKYDDLCEKCLDEYKKYQESFE